MLLLTATTDKLSLISSAVGDLDVHASYVDYNSGTITPGRQNTNITTATTTDIVASPGASTTRNVKSLNIRNAHASASCDVTVQYNQNGTLFELIKITLAAGDTLEYIEGVGFFKVPNPIAVPSPNASTADQAIGASVTNYITGSDIHLNGRSLKVGTRIGWHIVFTKSAAGTVSMTFDVRVGTAGTTGDTSRASLATGTQTGVADNGELEIGMIVRAISATGTVHTGMQMDHNLAATGLAPTNTVTSETTSGTFDTTATNLVFGVSLTTGALHAITIKHAFVAIDTGSI